MRNLKRALSLLLSSTMVLGMVVMGGSAAGYQDVDASNDNQEAIEVLQAVGIMSGVDDKGNFNPDGSLTRNEMAVVMAHLLNLDYDYYRGVNTFSDVPDWAAPYVAACVAEGVTAGIGNGLYGGDQKITAAQAGLMVMKALGYFQNQEDFGSDWQIATIRQASYINLFSNVNSDAESALTRGQVAQLVLNGLKSDMVTFTGDKGVQIGDVSVGYKAEYTPKTNAAVKYNSINTGKTDIAGNNQYYVQLGEELYNGDLKLKSDVDVFGRPARDWEYDGKEIGTYVNFDLMVKEYTTEVTGKDLYDVLTANTIKDYGLTVVIDGVSDKKVNSNIFDSADMNKNNKDTVGATGNGVLTQVFVDNEKKDITISIINTYLAIADENYNEKKDEASLTVYGVEKKSDEYLKVVNSRSNTTDDSLNLKLDSEHFDIASSIVEDDALLVTIANGEIQTAAKAKVISDVEITAFKKGSSVTVDGTKYDYADTAEYNYEVLDNYTSTTNGTNLKDTTYNVYLDAYGYAIAVDQVEVPNNYVFITGVDDSYSNLGTKNLKASAIFLDGTMKTIDITSSKGDGKTMTDDATLNSWFTYTVDKDGIYTVTKVAGAINTANNVKVAQYADDAFTTLIDKKHIYLPGATLSDGTFNKVYGNDDTVYLTASIKEIKDANSNNAIIIDGVDSVTTGLKNANIQPWAWNGTELANVDSTISGNAARANLSAGVYTLYKSNGYIIASVVVGEDATASKNLVYVTSSSVEQESYDKTADEWTWTRKVALNGEEVTLKEVSDSLTYLDKMDQYNWYQVKYNAEGEVIGVLDGGNDADFDNWTLNSNEYVTSIANLDGAIDREDTVLFTQQFTGDKMSMIGNVLYATKTTSGNNGFYVSDQVKVVLTQTNKNETTTTFEVGAKALKNIVDTLNEKSSSYNYVLSAMIENGVATTVVVRDLTNTYVKPDGGSNFQEGDYFKATTTVYSTGYAQVKLDITRPAFLDPNDGAGSDALDYTFDIYVNGKAYGTGSGSVLDGNTTGSYIWNNNAMFGYAPIKESDVVTVENFTFDFSDQTYLVKYYDQTGAELADSFFQSAPTRKVENTGTTITFQPKTTDYASGTYDWSIAAGQLVAVGGAPTLSGSTIAYSTGDSTDNTAKADPALRDYIKVVIDTTNLAKAAPTYELKKATDLDSNYAAAIDVTSTGVSGITVDKFNSTLTGNDDKLNIKTNLSPATGLADGAPITFTATMANGTDTNWGANVYTVTINTTLGSVTMDVDAATGTATSSALRVNGADVEITSVNVTVKTPLLAVSNVTMSGDNKYTFMVTFNQAVNNGSSAALSSTEVTLKDKGNSSLASNTTVTHTKDTATVTVTLNTRNLQDGDYVELATGIEATAGSSNTLGTTVKYVYSASSNSFSLVP